MWIIFFAIARAAETAATCRPRFGAPNELPLLTALCDANCNASKVDRGAEYSFTLRF
jgi:hypothetical protein